MSPVGRVAPKMRLDTADEDMLEGPFQRKVVLAAQDAGWGITSVAQRKLNEELAAYGQLPVPLDGLIFHPRIMYRSEPGWPDLTMIRRRDRRLIFAELKRENGKLTPRQMEVLGLLCGLFGVDWLVPGQEERAYLARSQPGNLVRSDVAQETALRVGVYVWRPSDMRTIEDVLR